MILCELKNLSLSEIFCSLLAHVSSFGQLRPRQQDVSYKMPAHELGNISQNERFISLKSILFAQRELAPLVNITDNEEDSRIRAIISGETEKLSAFEQPIRCRS